MATKRRSTKTGGTFRVKQYGPKSIVEDPKIKSVVLKLTRDEAAKMSAFLVSGITQIKPMRKKSSQEIISITLFAEQFSENEEGYATTITWR